MVRNVSFPTKIRYKARIPPLPTLFNMGGLANTKRHHLEIKSVQTGKEAIKASLFTDNMIIYIESQKELTTKKTPETNKRLINESQSLCYIPDGE